MLGLCNRALMLFIVALFVVKRYIQVFHQGMLLHFFIPFRYRSTIFPTCHMLIFGPSRSGPARSGSQGHANYKTKGQGKAAISQQLFLLVLSQPRTKITWCIPGQFVSPRKPSHITTTLRWTHMSRRPVQMIFNELLLKASLFSDFFWYFPEHVKLN